MSRGFYVPCAPFLYLVPDSAAPPGMELQQRSPGPFHYLINEQAKSLVALQELQNEVGALLEFRDLVMDTFPHLRSKMAPAVTSTTVSPSPPSHIPIPLASSLNAGRREWEPGIRVRRKLPAHKDTLDTSLTRRKPLSHQPKSGDTLSAGSSAVQDSGFSTETSSTKETPEAMTSPPKEIPSTGSGISSGLDEAEDELWNLLDVIHRKGTKLREEVESLQVKLNSEREEKRPTKDSSDFERLCKTSLDGGEGLAFLGDISDIKDPPRMQQEFKPGGSMRCVMDGADLANNLETNIKEKFRNSKLLLNLGGDMSCDENAEARELKFERDYLLDKVSEMEAETLATRARASQLKTEVTHLVAAKKDLEEQLKAAVTQKTELNSRIHDLHLQFVGKPTAGDNKKLVLVPSSKKPLLNQQTSFIRPPSGTYLRGPSGFTPVHSPRTNIPKPSLKSLSSLCSLENSVTSAIDAFRIEPSETDSRDVLRISNDNSKSEVKVTQRSEDSGATGDVRTKVDVDREVRLKVRLGTLDGIVSDPSRPAKGVAPDRRKMAAILGEFNPLELQRHLLTTSVENQALQQRLDAALSSRSSLQQLVDKSRDDNDELRFQLEKRNIELEGTRAQVRVLERLQNKPSEIPNNNNNNNNSSVDATNRSSFVVNDKAFDGRNKLSYDVHNKPSYDVHHSSTESSHDIVTTKSDHSLSSVDPAMSPKKRPSKIPLNTKLYTAPKPPPPKSAVKATSGKNGSLSQKNSLNGRTREPANGKRDSLTGKMGSYTSNGSLGSTGRKSFGRQTSTTVAQRARTAVARSNTVVIDHGVGGDGGANAKVRPNKLAFWSSWLKILDNGQS